MKQGIFTLQKLSQVWGANHQSVNTQIPDVASGAYTPDYPTRAEYRDDAEVTSAVDTASDTWVNVKAMNSNNGETAIGRTTGTQIPINFWSDLLINGRKAISEWQYSNTAYFNSLKLNTLNDATLYPKSDLKEGEFAFTSDGNDDIFLNLGGSPAQIVRFLRSDSHISYENVEDIVVREINWMQAATPSSNLAEGRLWYDTTNKLLMRYDGTSFKKVYYLNEDDNNLTETTTEGTGALKSNVLYVYAEVTGSPEIKTPKSIYYYDGNDLVEIGGKGNTVYIAECSTASNQQNKVLTVADTISSYEDILNQTVRVYFTNNNNYSGGDLTVNINNLGAIYVRNSSNLNSAVVLRESNGGYLDGVVVKSGNTYYFAVDAPQAMNTSATASYFPMLHSVAGGTNTSKSFYMIDQDVTFTGGRLKCRGFDFTQSSAIKIDVNTSASLVSEINEVTIGNEIQRSRGIKRIEVNMRLQTTQSTLTLFTVPAGYVAISVNGTPIIRNYVGMAWFRTASIGSDYAGQTFNIKYYDVSGTQHTVSVSGADFTCPYNDSVAFKISDVMGPGNVTAQLSSSTNKGPVAIYGTFLLIPDGNQTE